MNKEILVHIGFDAIKFGMTTKEVINLLGEPSEKEEESNFGETDITLEYEELCISLFFASSNQFKLDIITFSHSDFLYKGEVFIGLSEDKLVENAITVGLDDLVLEEDEELGLKSYESESEEISFYLSMDGVVDAISIMPKYVEDKPVWP